MEVIFKTVVIYLGKSRFLRIYKGNVFFQIAIPKLSVFVSKTLFLQGELVPHPFRHVYGQHGYFLTNDFAENPTNVLLSVVNNCEEYMLIYHGDYLLAAGYTSTEEYCEYIERHPDSMDALAVMLTVMINHVHVCIHH